MATRSTTGKKQLQNFHVRATLWSLFEKRAREMDCSTDYLINEAMRLYASTMGFLESQENELEPGMPAMPFGQMEDGRPTHYIGRATAPAGPPRRQSIPAAPPPMQQPVHQPVHQMQPTHPMQPTSAGAIQQGGPLRPSRPPPPPKPRVTSPGGIPGRPVLTLIFQGRKVAISADQFIIGRGAKSSDFMIKDANISRKHAAIIFHNNTYYIKDLGSTNGIEFNGKTVDSKRIDEGDVFTICGHDLHFTYNA